MTTWRNHPSLVDQLAGAYVSGALRGPARRRFEAVCRQDPAVAAAAHAWARRLMPLNLIQPPMTPSSDSWRAIAQRTGTGTASPADTPASAEGKSLPWWRGLLTPIPVAALALGVVLGTLLPSLWQATQPTHKTLLPDSYVGVLATADGKPGLIVSSLRHGRAIEIKQVAAVALTEAQELHLWRIDKAGQLTSIGPIPNAKFARVSLPEPAEKLFFTAVELAVSIEAKGSQPATPSQPFAYRGLCGKLWQ
jgi:anti-sigma-K factor RskA